MGCKSLYDKKLFSVDDCENLSNDDVRKLYKNHVNPAVENLFSAFQLGEESIDYAEGVWIYTKNKKKILDVTGGIGVLSHGHNNPRILNARLNYQKHKRMEVHKTIFSPYLAALSHNIAQLLPGDLNYSFFGNSGAEAVEGAIKLAYKYHSGKRKVILHSDISFHGKLLGSGSITASKDITFQFPKISNTDSFEFNNIESIIKKITEYKKDSGESDIYAIIVEPFSSSYLRECSHDFLSSLQKICNDNDIILIFDEVYSGWYKTGYLFCFMQYDDIMPDIIASSKSFGGGKASISAYISRDKILKKSYGNTKDAILHSSTYNGFGEECITAIEAINTMIEENYQEKSKKIESLTIERCNKIVTKFPTQVTEYRGKGTHFGIFLNTNSKFSSILKLLPTDFANDKNFIQKLIAASISDWMFKNYKIYVLFTTPDEVSISFSPSIIMNKNEINYFFDSLEMTLNEGIWKIVTSFTKRQISKFIHS
jgi:putrescine aminotransferase